jgi:hypothetical protein
MRASPISLPPELQDGYLIHSAVLARGLKVLLLPRQVLLASQSDRDAASLSFVHGVPLASTVAGVTHARDKRLRRYLFNVEKLPLPPGISISSLGSRSLDRFISRVGYPLVVMGAIGENPSRKTNEIWNKADLLAALSQMRKLPEDQFLPARSLVASAYGENILSFTEDEAGERVAPPHARLMVEKSMPGRYVRCFVCGDEFLAAVEFERSTRTPKADISKQLNQGFKSVAVRAAGVVPGLFAASVDLVLEDPAKDPDSQIYCIAELLERPRFDTYMRACPKLGPGLADALLVRQARHSTLPLEDPVGTVAVRVRLEGLREPNRLLPMLQETCKTLGLSGAVNVADPMEGVVEGYIQGAPGEIALVMEALGTGIHFGQRTAAIDEWQIPPKHESGFKIA